MSEQVCIELNYCFQKWIKLKYYNILRQSIYLSTLLSDYYKPIGYVYLCKIRVLFTSNEASNLLPCSIIALETTIYASTISWNETSSSLNCSLCCHQCHESISWKKPLVKVTTGAWISTWISSFITLVESVRPIKLFAATTTCFRLVCKHYKGVMKSIIKKNKILLHSWHPCRKHCFILNSTTFK